MLPRRRKTVLAQRSQEKTQLTSRGRNTRALASFPSCRLPGSEEIGGGKNPFNIGRSKVMHVGIFNLNALCRTGNQLLRKPWLAKKQRDHCT